MRCPDCGVSFDIHELISQECTIKQLKDLCEVICNTLDCGTDGKPTPCTHYQQAIDRAYEQGAREERRACYIIANSRESIIADKIASRGPMSQGGECPCNPIDGKCVYCGRPEGGGE